MEWLVTDDVARECWRRLLEFANIDLTVEALVRLHGRPRDDREHQNYVKQARQARVCVLQANEYFDAARSSTLFTAPNHLYYGMVSLSSLQMLLLGDGTRSLDYLRKVPSNAQHGLRFSTECTASTAREGLRLLETSSAEVLQRGHFLNWYSVLPETVGLYGLQIIQFPNVTSSDYVQLGTYETCKPEQIVGRKRTALELLRQFPDLFRDLRRYGVTAPGARTTHELRIGADMARHNLWMIHQVLDEERFEDLLRRFQFPPRFAHHVQVRERGDGLPWAVQISTPPVDELRFSWPDSRDTMDHQSISFADTIDTHELVDGFLLAYQLSMFSRYYPDLWVACIESHCKAAKLVELAVEILIKKAPIMSLSLLTPGGVTISTHREPWK